jgi:hypothetical protein
METIFLEEHEFNLCFPVSNIIYDDYYIMVQLTAPLAYAARRAGNDVYIY